MKKYIIGAVAGAIIATTISAYADEGLEKIEAYVRKGLPITLNGSQVTLESPAVMVDGSTYLKLRDVAKLTGLNVNWNEASQTVELSNGANNKNDTSESSLTQKITASNRVELQDGYSINIILDNQKEFANLRELSEIHEKSGYKFLFNPDSNSIYLVHNEDPNQDRTKMKTILENIPFKTFEGVTYIDFTFYKNNILSIVK